MADRKQKIQNPYVEQQGKTPTKNRTSGDREESMTESGEDAFGKKAPVRDEGHQDPSSSGTAPLGGETRDGRESSEPPE